MVTVAAVEGAAGAGVGVLAGGMAVESLGQRKEGGIISGMGRLGVELVYPCAVLLLWDEALCA